jgi:hypothetical protein
MTTEHDAIDFSSKHFDELASTIAMPVLRFNFTSSMMNKLTTFAKLHEHDNRFDFKNAWKLWVEQNKLIIHTETERLEQLGFTGNVSNKLFKSVRYYFRHKSVLPTVQPPRKTYKCMHKPILSAIDQQIVSLIKTDSVSSISPADAFDRFCTEQINLILDAIRISHSTDTNSISRDMIISYINKLKKTYKNRFYNIRVSCMTKT